MTRFASQHPILVLHPLARTFGVGALGIMAILVGLLWPHPAHATNGACKWEGGPGAPTYQLCQLEDCLGDGGYAQCSEPEVRPSSGFKDSQTDGQKFNYAFSTANDYDVSYFCQGEGGTFAGFYARPPCPGISPSYNGISDAPTEALAVQAIDAAMTAKFSNPMCPATFQSETAWGLADGLWGNTGPKYTNGLVVFDQRSRSYAECNGVYTIFMLKTRAVQCLIGQSRTLPNGNIQCVIPATCCLELLQDPVDPFTGGLIDQFTDYKAGVLELSHYYSGQSRYRQMGTGPFFAGSPDYWRFSYTRTLTAVSGNASLMAILQREDGTLEWFDNTGQEILNVRGAADRLTSNGSGWTLTLADNDVESYNSQGQLTSVTTRAGMVTTITYASNNAINQVSDPFGHKLTYGYNGNGQLTTVTLPDGTSTVTYAYSSATGQLTSVTYPDNSTVTYQYNDPNSSWPLTAIIDESNQTFASFQYDTNGNVTAAANADSVGGSMAVSTYTYSVGEAGTRQQTSAYVTDPLGKSRQYVYDNENGVYKLQYSYTYCPTCPNLINESYDDNGNVASRTDLNFNETLYSYDLTRNLEISRTEGLTNPGNANSATRTIATQWHPNWRRPTLESIYAGAAASGTPVRETSYAYDGIGNLQTKTITDPARDASRAWNYTYDGYGRLLTVDGPRTDVNDTTTYAYYSCTSGNECGQIQTITNAIGQATNFNTYNADGLPLTITDPNGVVTTLTYDARQRVTSRQVGTDTTRYSYYPTGLLQKVTLPDGTSTQYTYDAAHRLTEIQDGLGNSITYTLDGMGNRTTETTYDPSNVLSTTKSQVFNALDELYQQIGSAGTQGVTTTFTYDNNGNQATVDAPLSRNTTNSYDALNRISQIVDPSSGVTQFAYDAMDDLASVVDPTNLTTTYRYNGLGDLLQLISPATGVTVNAFDSGGNLRSTADARGLGGTYTYDALNRVTQVDYGDQSIVYSYDTGPNGRGRLTGASDAFHSLSWQYDFSGRVVNKSLSIAGVVLLINYGYTNARMTTLSTPSGQLISYSYANGRISAISINGSALLTNVVYEPFGPARSWTWANASSEIRLHDTDGNPSQISALESTTYSLDSAFRVVGASNASSPTASWIYGYDNLDHLISANNANTMLNLAYDGAGNRLWQQGASGPIYTATNLTLTYNNRGRLIGSSTGTFYVYDALGQRIEKGGSTTTLYSYDELGHLLGEYDGSGTLIQETVWLGDIPVATLRPDQNGGVDVYYIHADNLNSPKMITRPIDSAVMWRWDQDPFGSAAPNQNPQGQGTFIYNLRFPGQYYDGETGLIYNYFRDYDPQTGRYLESDPIGLNGGINTYSYVRNNPISRSDPRGLYDCTYSISAHSMNCIPDLPGDPNFSSTNYVSGNNNLNSCQNCQNNPDKTGVQNHGPIPVGTYNIGGIAVPGGSRRRLTPDPVGRSNLELHGCPNPATCSDGCIGATTNADRDLLNQDLSLEEGRNTLTVIP